jgi:hypothetical protein
VKGSSASQLRGRFDHWIESANSQLFKAHFMADSNLPEWDSIVKCHAERVLRVAILDSVQDAEGT